MWSGDNISLQLMDDISDLKWLLSNNNARIAMPAEKFLFCQ